MARVERRCALSLLVFDAEGPVLLHNMSWLPNGLAGAGGMKDRGAGLRHDISATCLCLYFAMYHGPYIVFVVLLGCISAA